MNAQADDRFRDTLADIDDERDTVDQLDQAKYTHPAVPVRITEPVAVQPLPTVDGQDSYWNLDTATAVKVLNQDPRRSRALLCADTNAVWIGTDQTAVQSGRGFRVPVGEMVELRNTRRWYARAVTATAGLAVINEQWAD